MKNLGKVKLLISENTNVGLLKKYILPYDFNKLLCLIIRLPNGYYPNLDSGNDCSEHIFFDLEKTEGAFTYFSYGNIVNTIRLTQPNIFETAGSDITFSMFKNGFKLYGILK